MAEGELFEKDLIIMKSLFSDRNLLYYAPRQVVSEKIVFPSNEPEMTEFDSAFLCGLIREKKPRKILEIGIAAGGTTAIILECLSQLGMDETTELYSIDCRELFYRGVGEKSGYLAEEYKEVSNWHGKHKVYLGKYFPEVADEIGNDIDFVVLDTTHRLPGEFLDFLAVFPYLKPHTCVVVHDICLNHIEIPTQIATQLLMDTVVGDKYLVQDSDREFGYPNIGAFDINNDTAKYIADVFNALIVTWDYLPEKSMYELYLQFFEKHYASDLMKLAGTAYELQSRTVSDKRPPMDDWRLSKSYRIGRMITFLPRKLKGVLARRDSH